MWPSRAPSFADAAGSRASPSSRATTRGATYGFVGSAPGSRATTARRSFFGPGGRGAYAPFTQSRDAAGISLHGVVAVTAPYELAHASEPPPAKKCVDRFAARATSNASTGTQVRRYIEGTYCSPFEREGWVYEDGTLKIAAYLSSGTGRESRAREIGDRVGQSQISTTLDVYTHVLLSPNEVPEGAFRAVLVVPPLCLD